MDRVCEELEDWNAKGRTDLVYARVARLTWKERVYDKDGLPSLSYKDSIYCFQVSLTSSESVTMFPELSVIPVFTLPTLSFYVNLATLAYTKSVLPLAFQFSNSSQTLSQ